MGTKRILTYVIMSGFVVACAGPQSGSSSSSSSQMLSSYAPAPSNVRFSLTDAPKNGLKEVNVNIDHIELFLKKGSTQKRLIIGQNVGMVNLLSLQNGVLLPTEDINMPNGVDITNIRLVLKTDNNHAIKDNNSRCDMQTPSAQQSGIKINLATPVHIESGYQYSMVVDFDADKSVVVRGNGSCLLKPVIRLMTVTKKPTPETTSTSSSSSTSTGTTTTSGSEVPVTSGTDSNVDPATTTNTTSFYDSNGNLIPPDQLGFDIHDPATYPDGITINDLYMYF